MKTLLVAGVAAVLSMSINAGKAAPRPDRQYGMTIMSAHVATDGSLVDGAGTVSSTYGLGTYAVKFDRSVENCAALLTPISPDVIGAIYSLGDAVHIEFYPNGSPGAPASYSAFYLIAFCPR